MWIFHYIFTAPIRRDKHSSDAGRSTYYSRYYSSYDNSFKGIIVLPFFWEISIFFVLTDGSFKVKLPGSKGVRWGGRVAVRGVAPHRVD